MSEKKPEFVVELKNEIRKSIMDRVKIELNAPIAKIYEAIVNPVTETVSLVDVSKRVERAKAMIEEFEDEMKEWRSD